ncbi:cell wall-binding repeat-containing protein [Herbiconiux sp. CPCC 203407]|uniref:Cell wall-binding repeat-containing protein n=1 Tax=Herbiconiux oxytropis TaxID=2970915 RepID=A0AA42BS56_9MICO|nr:cell wall-binding repeat-containing protein [Herbiconiux oxytropis]MCS5721000.1 cell wall-binding repeat-containing protein [Herbiconiux oxytropis]MCS5724477.1 cell wall-binding repeat-containing protein [Herbiconiux oxytropis]
MTTRTRTPLRAMGATATVAVALSLFVVPSAAVAATTPEPPSSGFVQSEEFAAAGVQRIGGADRYAVSAGVAASEFTTSPLVFVASGEGYADALSASAVAGAQRAPVLLVSRSGISDLVATQLTKLNPDVIVVVGGTVSVSSDVEKALGEFADDVQRVVGDTRYEVSARLSQQTLWPKNPVAYIASGQVFPDALSGSAAAGQLGGPVLLVQKDGIPGAIGLEIARLAPSKLIVLGGENTISESVVTTLRGIVRDTTRIGGADRYAVSAATSARAFPVGASTVFVASGSVFPDALSGSAAAIKAHGPVLLVTVDSVPGVVGAELDRLNPTRIVVLGGERTVSESVRAQLAGYIVPS